MSQDKISRTQIIRLKVPNNPQIEKLLSTIRLSFIYIILYQKNIPYKMHYCS